MASDDFENGVWRTIGGKHIFIRDGESLSSAMKRSGKFKSAKKKEEKTQGQQYEDYKRAKYNYRMFDERPKTGLENEENMKQDRVALKEEKTTKSGERDKRTITKKEMEESFREDVKKDPEFKAQIDKMREEMKARDQADRIKYQKGEIEKASGLKVKNAFESDLYSNGKEDRFELDDGRWIAHTKESFGQKDDTWTVNKLENGKIQSQKYDSYDDMIKHLGGNNKPIEYKPIKSNYNQGMDNEGQHTQGYHSDIATIRKELYTTGERYPGGSKTVWEVPELKAINKESSFATASEAKATVEKNRAELTKYSQSNKGSQSHQYLTEIKSDSKFSQPGKKWELIDKSDRYYKTRYLVKDEDGNMEWKWADMFEKNKSNNNSNSTAYKKAFQEYKKKHPNTKLNLQKFIDMSEGK